MTRREEAGRVPPSDLQAEQSILGALFLENNAFYDLPAGFHPGLFYRTPHQVTFRTMSEMFAKGEPVDILTLTERLRSQGELEAAGGTAYLAGLSDVVPSTANTAHYAGIVVERAKRRGLAHAGSVLSNAMFDEMIPVGVAEAAHEKALNEINRELESAAVDIKATAREVQDEIDAALQGEAVPGVPTGIASLDAVLKIMPTDLVLLGGRPANGKSFLALQIARSVAGQGKGVMFAGLEMHRKELQRRLIRAEARVVRDDTLKPSSMEIYERVGKANNTLSKLPMAYLGDPDLDVILREAARMQRKKGLGLLIIDYVQRLRIPQIGMTRDQALGETSQRLKDFAAKHLVPILCVAALSRESEKREDPRPRLTDLRESGRLEYDANSVLFVHIPSKISGTAEAKVRGTDEAARRKAELIIAKQRDTEDCVILEARTEFEFSRFEDIHAPEQLSSWQQHQRQFGGSNEQAMF